MVPDGSDPLTSNSRLAMRDNWRSSGEIQPDTGSDATPLAAEWARPPQDPIEIVTISREFGAGGSDLACALGKRLQWSVLDRGLVQLTADRLHLEPRHVEPLDEQCPSLFARLVSSALLMSPPELPVDVDTSAVLNPDAVAEAARAAMLAAAQHPPVVIVGHGAQVLFRGRSGTLHVRLVAPLAVRVERVCAREGCDRAVAAALARRMDDARRAYVRRYYHTDVRDPLLYDVQCNTGQIRIDDVADFLVSLVGARRGVVA